jgi:hypothetical protein
VNASKPLQDHEKKFYGEYLSATMPAKIESICGADECHQYERLLERLKTGSSEIKLHFHGLRPFVTKKRFIQPQTPDAGPIIEIADEPPINHTDNQKLPLVVPATAEVESKSLQSVEPAKSEVVVNAGDNKPGPEEEPKTDATTKIVDTPSEKFLPPSTVVVAMPNLLQQFMSKMAWVQCRKCGHKHEMPYANLAANDHFYCGNCGFLMSTVDFSKKVNKDKTRIAERMSKNR